MDSRSLRLAVAGEGQARSLRRFFVLTFVLSWLLWVPLALTRTGVLHLGVATTALVPLALPGVLMPSVAAVIVASRSASRAGVRTLLGRLLIWRAGWLWAVTLLMQPAVLLLTVGATALLGPGSSVGLTPPANAVAFLVFVASLAVAATGEEIGWRGYALPALQSVHSPLKASVILGLAAATWHLPYWMLQGVIETYGVAYFVMDYVFVVALTIQLTWIFNRTGGSVLIPVVFHTVFNALNVGLLPVTSSVPAFAVLTAIECAVALLMIGSLRPNDAPESAKAVA